MDVSVSAVSSAFATLQTLAASGSGQATAAAAASPPSSKDTSTSASVQTDLTGGGLYALSQSIGHALSAADAAASAGQGVLDSLHQMQNAAIQAADPNTSSGQRSALDRQFQDAAAQIAPTLKSATVGGVNLVDGSQPGGLKVALGEGSTTTLPGTDMSLGGPVLGLQGASLRDVGSAASAGQATSSALDAATGALAGLQVQASGLAAHASLVQAAGQAAASPALDDGDGARLLALQVGQQLSAQPAAIANAAPQNILSLFKS